MQTGSWKNLTSTGELKTRALKLEVSDIVFHEIFIVLETLTNSSVGTKWTWNRVSLTSFFGTIENLGSQIHQRCGTYILPGGCNPFTQWWAASSNEFTFVQWHYCAAFCASLVSLTQVQTTVLMNNFTDHSYTIKRGSHVANVPVMTPDQKKSVKPIHPITTWQLLKKS